jgi:uncharacterized ion transporter superfamily protein YfcC
MLIKNKIPHVFIILFFLIILSTILTYIIPAGVFERVLDEESNQTIVIADSYSKTENKPVSFLHMPFKIFDGITSKKAVTLIFFILFIGGSFEIVLQTDSITLFFHKILQVFHGKRLVIIPIFVTLFSILGFTMGLSTASIMFVPIGIIAAKYFSFDKLTGVSMVALGTNAGFAAGIFNPFTVGIAQTMAEVPLFSGSWIRWLLLVALLISTSWYIIHYTKKLDKKQNNTIIDDDFEYMKKLEKTLSFRHKLVLIIYLITFVFITYGLNVWSFKVSHMAVLFLVSGFASGIIYGFPINDICNYFVIGARKMMTGVFVIGLAATMRLILNEGEILDTIAYFLTSFTSSLENHMLLIGMFYGNALLDLLITSGTAHSAVAMPIMIPMGDYAGLTRQATVFAFQLGDGLVNLCSPLSTTLTGILAVSDIPYTKWVRFFFPLVGIYLVIGTIFIILASFVGY